MVTNTLAIDFRCRKCNGCHGNVEGQVEKLYEDAKTVTYFSHLCDRIYSGGGFEATGASITRLELLRFRYCQDLLCG